MKKFDLEKALAGEPIKLNNGIKAYILRELKGNKRKTEARFVGFFIENGNEYSSAWDENGFNWARFREYAIAGMWEEPNRIINGVEVPPCVTIDEWEMGVKYYYVAFCFSELVECDPLNPDYLADQQLFEKGLVFRTKEGAQAMAKALLNYTVEDV
ncbi:hypothetical protein KRX11_02285 [Pasteurellaceae bacterium TAE3-ERU1]|nr:hypothetical protein [Pasteurellaceae bacterium TAE3-ERU1]